MVAKCPECGSDMFIIRTTMETERVTPSSSAIETSVHNPQGILIVQVLTTKGIDTEENDSVAYCEECDFKIPVELEW